MQIAHLDTVFGQEIGQLLGHALGQYRYEYPLPRLDAQMDLRQHVVDLGARRAHFDLRIDQSGRSHQLLDHQPGMLGFVIGGRGRYEDRLTHLVLKFAEFERPVIERRRQAKAVVDQIDLARTVAVVHAVELADQHVRLVEEHQGVGGQVIDQGRRRFAGRGARKMPRVILDALAEPQLLQHLQVETRALLEALRLHQLHVLMEKFEPLAQFVLDGVDRAHHRIARRDVVRRRIDRKAQDFLPDPSGQRIE